MDKKNLPSLDELLNKVRQSEPVMQADEAINWLHAQKELPLRKHRFKPAKIIIMTSIISSIGIAVLLWIAGTGRTENLLSTEETMDHRPWTMDGSLNLPDERFQSSKEESTGAPESTAAMVHRPWSMVQDPSTLVDTPRVDTFNVIKIREDIDMPSMGEVQLDKEEVMIREVEIVDQKAPEKSGIGKEFVFQFDRDKSSKKVTCAPAPVGILRLESHQLQKLGIISDDGLVLFHQEKTNNGDYRMTFKNQNLRGVHSRIQGIKYLWGKHILPISVASCDGNILYGERFDDTYEKDILEALAVYVPVSDTDEYYIFWFQRNKDLYKLLASELNLKDLKHDDLYHIPLPAKAERKPETLAEQALNMERKPWEEESLLINRTELQDALGIQFIKSGYLLSREGVRVYEKGMNSSIVSSNLFNRQGEEQQWTQSNPSKLLPFYITGDSFYVERSNRILSLRIKHESMEIRDEFVYERLRLVGVLVEVPALGRRIFWYPYSPALKELLKDEEKQRFETKLSRINPDLRFGYIRPYYSNIDALLIEEQANAEALNSLTPSRNVLNKLGVELLPDSGIRIRLLAQSNFMVQEFSKEANRHVGIFGDTLLTRNERETLSEAFQALVCITDDLGAKFHMYNGSNEIGFNELIPVLVRTGKKYTLYDKINRYWRPDIILWFKPTPELLAILESDGAEAIWGGITSTEIPDTITVDCRYTEICRNKPGVFHNQLIFPNPATTYANFSWTSDEAANYAIKLYALNGKEVRAFEGLSAQSGKNQYMMDLSSLPPGIYMMILSSDKGDEIHERLVIRE